MKHFGNRTMKIASSLAMAGAGLGQTMEIAFAEGAFGSAASQQILEG